MSSEPKFWQPADQDRESPAPGARPAISIIVPVLNEAPVLAETLAGLPVAPDLEVIVVDGGSTDGSLEVAATLPTCGASRPPGAGGPR